MVGEYLHDHLTSSSSSSSGEGGLDEMEEEEEDESKGTTTTKNSRSTPPRPFSPSNHPSITVKRGFNISLYFSFLIFND